MSFFIACHSLRFSNAFIIIASKNIIFWHVAAMRFNGIHDNVCLVFFEQINSINAVKEKLVHRASIESEFIFCAAHKLFMADWH